MREELRQPPAYRPYDGLTIRRSLGMRVTRRAVLTALSLTWIPVALAEGVSEKPMLTSECVCSKSPFLKER
jgi:hypothetical protein